MKNICEKKNKNQPIYYQHFLTCDIRIRLKNPACVVHKSKGRNSQSNAWNTF